MIDVPGRMFPVEVFYSEKPEGDYFLAAIKTIMHIHANEPAGDILVFMTGEEEIENACAEIRAENKKI